MTVTATMPAAPAFPRNFPAPSMPAWASGARQRRARRGRAAYHSGLAAEDIVARHYQAMGASVLARRYRAPDGEIDLVVRCGEVLVFVEVKKRKYSTGWDSPVTERQWRRLECAALHYMVEASNVTRIQPACRFDVALVNADGQVSIIENARAFD